MRKNSFFWIFSRFFNTMMLVKSCVKNSAIWSSIIIKLLDVQKAASIMESSSWWVERVRTPIITEITIDRSKPKPILKRLNDAQTDLEDIFQYIIFIHYWYTKFFMAIQLRFETKYNEIKLPLKLFWLFPDNPSKIVQNSNLCPKFQT